jgi:DNA-binding Lrp family transcriptional regulator
MRRLDTIDRQMIDILQTDGRISIPALGERLGISRATAYNRFDRLMADGIIEGFTARVSPEVLGLHVAALVLVNIDQDNWREARAALPGLPGVVWVGMATGPFDVAVLIRCEDLARLRDVVLVELHRIPAVTGAQTFVLLDEPELPNAEL